MSNERRANIVKLFTPENKFNGFVAISCGVILTALFCHSVIAHDAEYFLSSNNGLLSGLNLIPVLLLSGLFGYVIAFMSFSMAFILSLIFNMDNSFTMIIYLVVIVCFSLIGRNDWFLSIWKTILLCIITLNFVGLIGYLCIYAIGLLNYDINTMFSTSNRWFYDIFSIFSCGIFLYVFFRFGPDSLKKCFPMGIIHTKNMKDNENVHKRLKVTKVSAKLTTTIFGVELILIIFVAIFMMVLFPDMKKIFASRSNISEDDLTPETLVLKEEFDDISFEIDDSTITFDLKMIFLMLCAGAPLAAFTSFYTKYFIAEPLAEMANFMEQYAYTSDEDKILYGHKINDIYINSNDEIEIMYDAVHATVYEIEAYIERMKIEQRLKSALEIAKRSNDAKSSFLSSMSHEIRTPINAILGMNEMVIRESTDKQIVEYATNIKSAGASLLGLVNDILDFSKIEAGKMEIIESQYHLGSTINDLINMISSKADEKHLKLEVNVDEEIPVMLIGDELRIKQCVTNILSNAVKYTDKGTITLNVGYRQINDVSILLVFTVIDTGIGIKEEDLGKLYAPFVRIDEIRNRTIEGSGLGMSIVKKLLALMDSKLHVKSEFGKGSEFTFGVKQQVVSWEEIGDFKVKYKEYIQSSEKYHHRFQAPTASILVVDDTDMNLTVIKSLLKQTLVQVDTATSGYETIDLVKKKKYDIIFLDHRMPGLDGIETFERLKSMEDNLCIDIPVVALTANAVSGAKAEYVAHGFTDYLAKPVDGTELEKLIEFYLPPEKIASVSIYNGEMDFVPSFNEGIPEDSFINDLKEINAKEALKNCGEVEILESVVRDFYISIESKAAEIKAFLDDKDIRNYTVYVHALKSSARLIGALELSAMAAELEEFGNNENYEVLVEKTPLLLEKYVSYREYLKAADENAGTNKPEIAEKDLDNALKDIKELVEAYDFDTVDSIMDMLKEYRIPASYKDKFLRIRELIVAVDRDGLLELL